jgi:hypothetical protein
MLSTFTSPVALRREEAAAAAERLAVAAASPSVPVP